MNEKAHHLPICTKDKVASWACEAAVDQGATKEAALMFLGLMSWTRLGISRHMEGLRFLFSLVNGLSLSACTHFLDRTKKDW